METEVIKNLVQEEFLRRVKSNKNYSLRSYAKSLDVDPSLLCKLFKGQRTLSSKMAMKLSHSLGLSTSEAKQRMAESFKLDTEHNRIEDDVFIIMSDWYHFAILELFKLDDFQSDPSWMAKTLGLKRFEVKLALERLERLKLIESCDEGYQILSPNNEWFNYSSTTTARRMMQKQLLSMAQEAVDRVDFNERSNSSLTIAINDEDLPLFKKKINEFINDSIELRNAQKKKKNSIYQICVALFPLSRRNQ